MAKYMVCYGMSKSAETFETDSFEEAVKQYAVWCLGKDSIIFCDLETKKIIAQCVGTAAGTAVGVNPGA